MSVKAGKKKKKIKYNYSLSLSLPLMLIVAIVPLIVRLKVVPLEGASALLKTGQESNLDFFSYYKVLFFNMFIAIGTIIFLYNYYINKDIYIKKSNIYYPMIVYSVFAILSTIFSSYRQVALSGFMDRYESVYVLIGYMLCVFLAMNLIDEEKQLKYLLYALGLSSIIISIIGIFQYIGLDLFACDFGKELIVPSQYKEIREGLNFQFAEERMIYTSLFNPNYVGVYMSMLFTLASTILVLSRDIRIRVFFGLVAILAFINLLGSGSRTAMLAIGFFLILLLIVFRFSIFKRWKLLLLISSILIMVFFAVNIYSDGVLTSRLVAVVESMTSVQVSNLQDIIFDENKAKILIDDYEINILYAEEAFSFKDKDSNDLEIEVEENQIVLIDPPYNQHSFEIYAYEGYPLLRNNIVTNTWDMTFDVVIDDSGEFKFLVSKGKLDHAEKAPSWGFQGRERMATGRGYIWSRSIPMMKDRIFLGGGPDTYALYFPNDDYIGKLHAYGVINMVVDKPHSIYLQTGINTGLISLLAMLAIFFIYIKSTIEIYINKKIYNNFYEIAGISIFFAVSMYIMTGFLNDSLISVAPVFWVLLGTGMGVNIKLKEEDS